MPESTATARKQPAAFDMKAGQFTIPTLILRDTDTDALDEFLARQIARSPSFFDQAPVAIDVSGLQQAESFTHLPMVVGLLRGHGLVPVGVRGASSEQRAQAQALELAILPPARRAPRTATAAASTAQGGGARPTVVDKLVRSGQRIYARDADLVLLRGVSSGAEVVADGHIHAYGALRGRAIAGVSGDVTARIFCQALGAELVSIAGLYRVSENLESRYLGRAVQIARAGDSLKFSLL
jgi:septum site-determining protein MinC